MKKISLFLVIATVLMSCQLDKSAKSNIAEKETNTWYQTYDDGFYDIGTPTGYVNEKGDTVIPLGKYDYIFTDTFTKMAIVYKEGKCIGIDKNETELFEVYWYDNGPDYVEDGLFRIKHGDKIGYANLDGEIIIKPQYKCATPFENGQAQVAYECNLVKDGEYTMIENAQWLKIDTEGKTIEEPK